MEITSYETAKRLKEAGFPQPEPKEGQFWYGLIQRQDEPIYIFLDRGSFHDRYGNYHKKEAFEKFGTYAPTATDILRELGSDYSICCFGAYKIQWEIERHMPELFNILPFTWIHENPAEAAALAWLDKNKNK